MCCPYGSKENLISVSSCSDVDLSLPMDGLIKTTTNVLPLYMPTHAFLGVYSPLQRKARGYHLLHKKTCTHIDIVIITITTAIPIHLSEALILACNDVIFY